MPRWRVATEMGAQREAGEYKVKIGHQSQARSLMLAGSTKGYQKSNQNKFYFVIDETDSLLMVIYFIQLQ